MDDRALVPSDEHAAHPHDPFLGRFVGGYPLVGLLRPSSVGPTYRALKEPGRREVAIKVLRPAGSIEPLAERLRRVMPIVFGLSDPSVVKPLDYGVEADGVLFVVTELVQGTALSDLVVGRRAVRPARATPIIGELLRALADAHRHGLVHGNLKPSSVLLVTGPDGKENVRLLELGVAEVLRPREAEPRPGNETLGTPLYLAPEQAKGLSASPLSDLYSTGVILYELLSGAPPFDRGDPMQTARAHVETPIPQFAAGLGISPALDRVVCRALAKLPEDRFASAAVMAEALAELSAPRPTAEEPAKAEPPSATVAPPEPEELEDAEEPAAPALDADEEENEPEEPASAPVEKVEPAAPISETPPSRTAPPPRSKTPFVIAGGALIGLGLLVAAFLAIRASPPDGSGSMLDLVRTVGGGADEARLPALPPESQDDPAQRPGQPTPPRKIVRREAPKAVVAAVLEEPPDAATPPVRPTPTAETMLGTVEKPDGSLLVNCTNRCKVYVDGGLVGESPKAPIPLKEGEHVLRAVNPDTGQEREQTIKIKSAQRTRVTLEL
ncbi:MAG TPA: protein kinase [Myxococcales bacterium]